VKLYTICYDSEFTSKDTIWTISKSFKDSFILSFDHKTPKEPHLLNREWKGFNLNFPNLSSIYSLSDQIEFAALRFSNGEIFESEIKETRKAFDSTNSHNYSRDVLKIRYQQMRSNKSKNFSSQMEMEVFESIPANRPKRKFSALCAIRRMAFVMMNIMLIIILIIVMVMIIILVLSVPFLSRVADEG
jgi:hypothetical protein